MGSCHVESAYAVLGLRCPSINTSSLGVCGIWEDEYTRSREVRMWTRAKDLLYGYAVIWVFMCIPRIYSYLKQVQFKRYFFFVGCRGERNVAKQSNLASSYVNTKQYHDCGCPVCLASTEEMSERFPVVGNCGHAICGECFSAMWNHGKLLLIPVSCPLCIAPIHKVIPAAFATGQDQVMATRLDRSIRRYNLIFNGSCIGILPSSRRNIWMFCVDTASRALRLGYFFILFDRKMMNTVSFFVLHFFIAIIVEYFENAYLQSLLEHL